MSDRLSTRTIGLVLAALCSIAEGGIALAIVLGSNHEHHKALATSLDLTAGFSFVFSGLVAIHRRPDNRTGIYLAAVGYLWFLGALGDANNAVVFTVGQELGSFAFIPFAALILSFPTGRLDRPSRAVVHVTAWFVVLAPVLLLVDPKPPGCNAGCPTSPILIHHYATLAGVLEVIETAIPVGLCLVAVVILAGRWRAATEPARRVLFPVYATGTGCLVALLVNNLLAQIDSGSRNDVLESVFVALFGAVPIAFLFGILQSRLARGSVAGLITALDHGRPLRSAIADALGDPSVGVAFWLESRQRYVDREGRTLDLDHVPPDAVSVVERDGRRVGALLHDESLAGEPELLESVAAAAAFAIANERLQAELREQHLFLFAIVDTAPSLLVNVDRQGRIRHLNPATLAASGHDDQHEVRGQFFWDVFIEPSERDAMRARFEAAAPDHPPSEYENTFTNARGQRVSVIWRGAPVRGDTGEVESIIAAGLDVTSHRRQEEEIRASRGRIVAAADQARRRLERNLHDGAQQRLVSLSLSLRLAQAKLGGDTTGAAEILAGASEELALALEELRELARGIHPALLTDRGLDAALEGLAARSLLPIELDRLGRRLPESIEAAAYYVVSESVANAVKHAKATAVTVALEAVNGHVVIDVSDDGVGGADAAGGSGLRGLADRLSALDGRLSVESPPGQGTRVVAEIPVPHESAAE